ncbi:hypothetical protein PE36_08316, partial [Moritella sp. PE36]
MKQLQAVIPPFEYLGGKDVTEKLVSITNSGNFQGLTTTFGIPKSTIAT